MNIYCIKQKKWLGNYFFILLIVLFSISFLEAQTRVTSATKVILVVEKESNQISNIELFSTEITESEMFKKYPKSIFFLGLFKGRYELNNNVILPKSESILILNTERQLFSKNQFSPSKNLKIGNIKTKEISRKKGEIIIKII